MKFDFCARLESFSCIHKKLVKGHGREALSHTVAVVLESDHTRPKVRNPVNIAWVDTDLSADKKEECA